MGIRETISSLFEKDWYRKEEWAKVDRKHVTVIDQENGCSWDVSLHRLVTYKHKDTCEERNLLTRIGGCTFTETVFTHPKEEEVEFFAVDGTVPHISEFDTPNLHRK